MDFEHWAIFILLLPAWIAVSSTKVEYGMVCYALGLLTGWILMKPAALSRKRGRKHG